ncbi:cytochrome P450 [Halocatena salina]|uniref:Cytochrome P450 n=1 Tax=Halocatena salina TaxID=2934340 RepID=A0A8U0A6Z3_9EURY|nr:cytochrome P450 [Halocatena salina]UPM44961.1 cytochrome P450 [Halocatena salina]
MTPHPAVVPTRSDRGGRGYHDWMIERTLDEWSDERRIDVHEVMTFLIAEHETTTVILTYALYLLSPTPASNSASARS